MNMSDKQLLDYVLTHEYYHIKRFDAFWKTVLLLALCVHWFNPVVWVMFVLANRDLELTCDEAVLRRFGTETKKDYARILISMVEQGGRFTPLYTGFSKNATQERILSIMKSKKNSVLAIVIAVLLVAGASTVFALATPDRPNRNINSSLPDGDESDVSLEEEAAYFQGISSDSIIDAPGLDIQLVLTPVRDWETAIESVELIVTLGDGSKLSKTYAEYFGYFNPYFLQADLLGNSSDVIILVIPIYGSTYDASDVHVLKIEDDKLIEILTILDTPIEGNRDISEYEQTLFVIPQPADNFGLEHDWYHDYCTGASIVTVDGKTALRIRHLMKEVIPYSVVHWNGQEWTVAMQYADDVD